MNRPWTKFVLAGLGTFSILCGATSPAPSLGHYLERVLRRADGVASSSDDPVVVPSLTIDWPEVPRPLRGKVVLWMMNRSVWRGPSGRRYALDQTLFVQRSGQNRVVPTLILAPDLSFEALPLDGVICGARLNDEFFE